MTQYSLTTLIEVRIPIAAMRDAIVLANRLGDDVRSNGLLKVARAHGRDALLVQAIEIRLSLLAMLLNIDPATVSKISRLTPTHIAEVLVAFPIHVRDSKLDFDGDALYAALRLTAEPQGTA